MDALGTAEAFYSTISFYLIPLVAANCATNPLCQFSTSPLFLPARYRSALSVETDHATRAPVFWPCRRSFERTATATVWSFYYYIYRCQTHRNVVLQIRVEDLCDPRVRLVPVRRIPLPKEFFETPSSHNLYIHIFMAIRWMLAGWRLTASLTPYHSRRVDNANVPSALY